MSILSLFSHSLAKESFVFFDVETTGLFPLAGDRVVEIAMIKCEKGSVSGTFEMMFNPGIPMPQEASAVNKITDEMLADKPLFDVEIGKQIIDFIGSSILIAHNSAFDLGFLSFELASVGLIFRDWKSIDTLRMAQKLYPGQKNKLESLMRRYNMLPEGDLHRALVDTDSLRKVFFEMLNETEIRNKTLEQLIKDYGFQGINFHKFIPAKVREAMVDREIIQAKYKKRNGEIVNMSVLPIAPVWSGRKWFLIAQDEKTGMKISLNGNSFIF